jgi:hypothetical protein
MYGNSDTAVALDLIPVEAISCTRPGAAAAVKSLHGGGDFRPRRQWRVNHA